MKKQKSKVLKTILIALSIIIVASAILVGLYFYDVYNAEDPRVTSVELTEGKVCYSVQEQYLRVVYEDVDGMATEGYFEIYLDDELYEEVFVDFTERYEVEELYALEDLDVGFHNIKVDGFSIDFEVVDYEEFELIVENVEFLVKGMPNKIAYKLTNTGDYDAAHSFIVETEDKKNAKISYISAGLESVKTFTVEPKEDMCEYTVDDIVYRVPAYKHESLMNGQALINCTVNGYRYINAKNESDKDIVVYVSKEKCQSIAVSATYIKAGEEWMIKSFPKDDYVITVQTGDYWLPEIARFGDNEIIYEKSQVVDFINESYKSKGDHHTYIDFVWSGSRESLDEYYDEDNRPPLMDGYEYAEYY